MKRTFRFYREEDDRWFVELPEWDGEKDDLEMVLGAEMLLQILAGEDGTWVYVEMSDEPFEEAKVLTYDNNIEFNEEMPGWYNNDAWHGPSTIWLCAVTIFVFGYYPDKIYYK